MNKKRRDKAPVYKGTRAMLGIDFMANAWGYVRSIRPALKRVEKASADAIKASGKETASFGVGDLGSALANFYDTAKNAIDYARVTGSGNFFLDKAQERILTSLISLGSVDFGIYENLLQRNMVGSSGIKDPNKTDILLSSALGHISILDKEYKPNVLTAEVLHRYGVIAQFVIDSPTPSEKLHQQRMSQIKNIYTNLLPTKLAACQAPADIQNFWKGLSSLLGQKDGLDSEMLNIQTNSLSEGILIKDMKSRLIDTALATAIKNNDVALAMQILQQARNSGSFTELKLADSKEGKATAQKLLEFQTAIISTEVKTGCSLEASSELASNLLNMHQTVHTQLKDPAQRFGVSKSLFASLTSFPLVPKDGESPGVISRRRDELNNYARIILDRMKIDIAKWEKGELLLEGNNAAPPFTLSDAKQMYADLDVTNLAQKYLQDKNWSVSRLQAGSISTNIDLLRPHIIANRPVDPEIARLCQYIADGFDNADTMPQDSILAKNKKAFIDFINENEQLKARMVLSISVQAAMPPEVMLAPVRGNEPMTMDQIRAAMQCPVAHPDFAKGLEGLQVQLLEISTLSKTDPEQARKILSEANGILSGTFDVVCATASADTKLAWAQAVNLTARNPDGSIAMPGKVQSNLLRPLGLNEDQLYQSLACNIAGIAARTKVQGQPLVTDNIRAVANGTVARLLSR